MPGQGVPDDGYERFHALTPDEWRAWLAGHHAASPGVWLVTYKKATGRPRVEYARAVEEALCFGWIDSRPGALDAERSMQLFTPRRAGSPWSKLNKQRVERLLADGRMAPAGRAKIEAAKRDGSWAALDAVEALVVPEDLGQALAATPAAEGHFRAFSPTVKKQLLWWVESARRPETRRRRIEGLVAAAAQGRNAQQWTPKRSG